MFRPIRENRVTLYACGPTAAESPNIAHCRRFLVADLINRYLGHLGYRVDLYMNFTDLDDNTISGSIEAGEELAAFTGKFISYNFV